MRIRFQTFRELFFSTRFVFAGNGARYGIGTAGRLRLLLRAMKNNKTIPSKSSWILHIHLMNEILGIPRDIEGDVVECGCLHGASTANLSLACAITGRKLYVCDSFEGLPEPVDDDDQYTTIGNEKAFYKWKKGKLASIGGIEGVMENVRKFGSIESCVFVKGFFSDTLPTIKTRKIVLIFEDADMYSSVKDVVRYLWKKLQPGCRLYTHEPFSREVVSIFYDREWWKENIGEDYPGLTGSGSDGAMDGIARIWAGYAVRSSKWAVVRDGKSVCF